MNTIKIVVALALVFASVAAIPLDDKDWDSTWDWNAPWEAPDCNDTCISDPEEGKWCRCSGDSQRPGGIVKDKTPQIVHLTFERAVTVQNYDLYQKIFNGRVNPNGVPISGTFFVSHEYTDYYYVYQLWRQGHEIGLNSISFKPEQTYWKNLNATGWYQEIGEQKLLLQRLTGLDTDQFVGMRAPLMQVGGDQMYAGVHEDLLYENSRSTQQNRPNYWPYTADFKSNQDCVVEPCPVESYPGFWVYPIVTLLGNQSDRVSFCTHLNTCTPPPNTTEETYNLLMDNFNNHYNGQRTPLGLHATHGWFIDPVDPNLTTEVFDGYLKFLDEIGTYPDVHIVSIKKGVDWMKNPQPNEDVDNIESWVKPAKPTPDECDFPLSCYYSNDKLPEGFWGDRRMRSCMPCPTYYPWVGNPLGANPYRP